MNKHVNYVCITPDRWQVNESNVMFNEAKSSFESCVELC